MQLTRQQIIDYLQANRMATAIEMSQALQVTAANIRHHLKLLTISELVEVVGSQPRHGRGRPMQLYSLTENALKHNLDGLASALLCTLLTGSNESEKLNQIATYLLEDYQAASNIHARLNQAIKHLNELHYQASWEASPNGPRLILRNCPYASILLQHPELCRMDTELLAQMLGQTMQQTAKLARFPDGAPHCAFVRR
jgi:predicted ArsR family transcriptional regulator